MNLRAYLAAFLITGAAAACGTTETRPTFPANRRLIDADREPGSWLTHGRTYNEQRFSPAELACVHDAAPHRAACPGSGEQLTPADAELIRGYVAKRAARP